MKRDVYNTKHREEVLSVLKNAEKHLTAEEICSRLRKNGKAIGVTTVYRQLSKLENEGLLRKYTVSGESACYSPNDEKCHRHFHLKCIGCGSFFHLDCEHLKDFSAHIESDHGFVVDPSKTCFYGYCKECEKKKESI